MDALVRTFIHEQLSYRFIEAENGRKAQALELAVRRGALSVGRPLLNPDRKELSKHLGGLREGL